VQRPEIVPGVPVWISDANVAAGKRINKAAFTVPTGTAQGNLARNVLNGFGATEVDLPPGSSRFLQPVQSPQLRSPDQLHDLSPFRPSHPDARRRRPDRRPESAVPDRRPAFGATGAETYILKPKPVTTTADRRNQIPPHRLTATRQSEPNDGRRETVTGPAIPLPIEFRPARRGPSFRAVNADSPNSSHGFTQCRFLCQPELHPALLPFINDAKFCCFPQRRRARDLNVACNISAKKRCMTRSFFW
jgi:hypothetical protein